MPGQLVESERLELSKQRQQNWQRWGPYLSERQWGTVREDYSEDQNAWGYLPHDHARSRAYRWGEDGLLGICDRQCRLCFSFAFWNGKDPILKERLFGLTGPEGNHGEDVKECYYYLDSSPTHSYMKGLYKYPQGMFPYEALVKENQKAGKLDPEVELLDIGAFDDNRYFDCKIEYAKRTPNDILIRASISNPGPEKATIHVLSQWWFRNTWIWECTHEGCTPKPSIRLSDDDRLVADHVSLGRWHLAANVTSDGQAQNYLFTDNETNPSRHPGVPTSGDCFKDGFHRHVIHGEQSVYSSNRGTKAGNWTEHQIEPGGTVVLEARMASEEEQPSSWFGAEFDQVFSERIKDTDDYYAAKIPASVGEDQAEVSRQAYAGLLWTKQFYHYVVDAWLDGDKNFSDNVNGRQFGRNSDWRHLFNRDVISMPDKWEYPWYAAWDLAFHMLPMAKVDLDFAKEQLLLFLREWYMHPNGSLPAYEWALGDVNPPVHAWACWNIYKASGCEGSCDKQFLARAFQKLLLNFTWWVNRKDPNGKHIFSGGFLGLDNIGVFDRSKPLPTGGVLLQADATAWMAFFCGYMLKMAVELAEERDAHADMASKFLEHYLSIAHASNALHNMGLWDEEDGFYYDHIVASGNTIPLRVRSLVGLMPLCTPVILNEEKIAQLPGFKKRTDWFLANRPEIAGEMNYLTRECPSGQEFGQRLLALPSEDRLRRLLTVMLDEKEFLSDYGIRSLSAAHEDNPFVFHYQGGTNEVRYIPGESDSYMFGGNSNWRGPVWFPMNYLIIESLKTYHQFYGDQWQIECPTGSGNMMNLQEVADEIESRLIRLFVPGEGSRRPCHGQDEAYATDPNWQNLILFYEYFHGDNGKGLGAAHQTGWTALVATMIENLAARKGNS